ncbi:MAG: T9SS type A sorting domain-containing protein [Flavobacterium sp.]
MSATIRDITAVPASGDPDGGDIRNAKARFLLRGINPANSSVVVAEFSTEWINVSLLASDVKVGSILKDITLSIPSSLDSVVYEIKVEVDGYYNCSTATSIIGTLTLSKSLNDFVTFGGNLKMTPNTSSGYYPSNNDSKINFGGSVKYNKNGTNMQGGINIIWRTGTKIYQIKGIVGGSNGSMSVNISNANELKAVVNAKANVYDTQTGLAVPNSSGAIVTLNLVDKGEPGVNDQISIELRNSAGTLLLSSKWTGVKTDLLTLTGGNIQVRSTTNTVSSITKEDAETIADVKLPFNVKAYPNPSSQYFNLNIEGNDGEESEVMVYNSAGILIDQFKGKVNQEYQIGDRWSSGMYLVQIKKGMEIKTIKLIKRN